MSEAREPDAVPDHLGRIRQAAPWVAAAVLVAAFILAWKAGLVAQLSDHERLVESMRESGWRGPALCIAIQFIQVVVFMIPGEITQVAAGYVFGALAGFVYSVIGIMLGSAFAYGFGRLVGRPLLSKVLGEATMTRLDHTMASPKARTALFLLFLLPGAPKDAMSYGAGATNFRLGEFVLISGLARMPAMLFSTVFGAQFYERDYAAMAWTGGAALAVAALFFVYQRRIAL